MDPVGQDRNSTPETADSPHILDQYEIDQDGKDQDEARQKTLCFTVRFRRPWSGAPSPHASTQCFSQQGISITFQDTYMLEDISPLSIKLRDSHHLDFGHALFDPTENPDHEIFVIESAIDLFRPPDSSPHVLWSWRQCPALIWSSSRSRCLVVVGLLALLLLLVIVGAVLASHLRISSYLSRPLERSPQSNQRVHVQHAALTLVDDITQILHLYVETPLPFFVGVQDLVDRHYLIDGNTPRPPTRATPSPDSNITARVFLGHVFYSINQLCDTVQDWMALSRPAPPGKEDLALLCLGLRRAVADLSPLWSEASTTLALSWLSSFELVSFYFQEAVKAVLLPLDINVDPATTPTTCFYNYTSNTFIRQIYTHLFSSSPIVMSIYEAAEQLVELSDALLAVITSGSLLVDILSKGDVITRSRHIRTDAPRGWFAASPPRSRTDQALSLIAPAYDEVAPLLRTAVSATWAVSATRERLQGLVEAFEGLGNRTRALCSAPVPVACGDDNSEWWRGLPWVSETAGDDGRLIRTFWYLPRAKEWPSLLSWGCAKLRQTQMEWKWAVLETERYWHGKL
ncbi:hypothetical protein CGRA01v4_15046 [Colletotrichum graminicola]|uniref:Uncharacterized protein n=1 Tax=Colletotrichum graminicola (strain M1.001 / M2 / FGSC 10212) TaxID=645133 RepID=E3R091_COLGM|nr:uncharacterized protein GLRG_11688 [Colletotrichum graminicola M1.001]EFQ36529.1 hypothetical protein GLRG_11688 [Colletotrichum graminicola M1.001]WDK23754.1 hypothetical protein CGRA01v4_15046 [Colletotrichum graminicola]